MVEVGVGVPAGGEREGTLFDHVYISPISDVWHYPTSKWAVWERGNRIGTQGRAAMGFRRLNDAKAWANERFGIKSWSRNDNGDYVPKELA